MPGHMPSQLALTCATCRIGAQTLPFVAGTIAVQDSTPAWMLAPRGTRRPYLTDPPRHA
ncbi:hypothetical protein [Salinicola avicenniae]|uniref:hypothetical protein n=1 Tax=Salinicola avicenniae TaxID=2916836 RepID=UPI002073EDE3|nr:MULTISPECIES: hypothetical protein [unclassified Salinicola]